MAWRGLHLSQPARISVENKQVKVLGEDKDPAFVPLEDLAFLILDTPRATVTTGALSALMEAGTVVVHCDARHHPNGLALPFGSHWRQGRIAQDQVAVGEPFKKRCWQRIVRAKVENQAAALERSGKRGAGRLRSFGRSVASGDPENIEAQAARFYWSVLFDNFRRHDDADIRNAALNYGYAIVRACLARAITAVGLIPAFGLHHKSSTNPFNLVDDLLEPLRPSVDLTVLKSNATDLASDSFTVEERRALAIGVQGISVDFPRKNGAETLTLLPATERMAQSLARAFSAGDRSLLELPRLTTGTLI